MRIYKVFTLLGLFISIFYNCSLPADDEEDSSIVFTTDYYSIFYR